MQFALTEDQTAVRDMAREFAAEKIAPFAIKWDDEKRYFPSMSCAKLLRLASAASTSATM